ncbi:hypothetical protein [Kitasatospora herbaricolor]|uniref:Replication restart DNA helicase PriA n=1 Tax=Kitasatospora herbaricolor TaxID=68217 RepID=A0ABZ1W245_9ACTN|nr:hypothetical protein [Kitasatospora herbaricolor]
MEHALCPACGSADTSRLSAPQGRRSHRCGPCDRAFEPRICPYCGSVCIEGSVGVAGALYKQPAASVRCTRCRAELPVLHDPYGQG